MCPPLSPGARDPVTGPHPDCGIDLNRSGIAIVEELWLRRSARI